MALRIYAKTENIWMTISIIIFIIGVGLFGYGIYLWVHTDTLMNNYCIDNGYDGINFRSDRCYKYIESNKDLGYEEEHSGIITIEDVKEYYG